jgi:ubiquinone/menaquinone biosynthesis C-methylase UbiE
LHRLYYLDLVPTYDVKTFLDVGCGFATTWRLLRKHRVDVAYTGIDITAKFIEICKKRYPKQEFYRYSANKMFFEDKTFDMVACRAVLEHLREPYTAIAEMARVAKKVVVITWFKEPRPKVEKLLYREYHQVWENIYRRDKIINALEINGLTLADEFKIGWRRNLQHTIWVCEKG